MPTKVCHFSIWIRPWCAPPTRPPHPSKTHHAHERVPLQYLDQALVRPALHLCQQLLHTGQVAGGTGGVDAGPRPAPGRALLLLLLLVETPVAPY